MYLRLYLACKSPGHRSYKNAQVNLLILLLHVLE
jgi:hypothetical protein